MPQALHLEIDPKNESHFGPCNCCGQLTSRIWGYVFDNETALAAYFVEWTPGHVEQDATFDFIIGEWGEDAPCSSRKAVSIAYRVLESRPSFMVIDAGSRPVGISPLVGEALSRESVLRGNLHNEVFALCDLVYGSDSRVSTLHPRKQE